jgi:type IV fimbrial biogenesis protein FimT
MLNAFPKTRALGFSLIEMMIGVAILGILLAAALPSYRAWMLNTQIRNAADSIQNGLQRARAEAIKRNTPVDFVLAPGNNSTWLVQLPGGGGGGPLGLDPIDSRSDINEGSKEVISAIVLGANTVTFDNLGRPTTGAFTVNLTSTILTAAESLDLRVTVGFGGNIKMCDPHAGASSPRSCN